MSRTCAVTGGCGFIGAYLVRRLVAEGWSVTVLDNLIRAEARRIADVEKDVRFLTTDIRDEAAVTEAVAGCDVVFHLAAVNGTENFYKRPELVLDVGIRGALAVVGACRAADVPDLVVASSAEVYQTPQRVPTDESVALMLPDSLNPRYSYGGSKIASELIAFNYGQEHFRKVQVFRPHNVYGPDMGFKHVIPQIALRAMDARDQSSPALSIEGDGSQTRAFAYVDDVVDGIVRMYLQGANREVYHIGNDEEVTIGDLAQRISRNVGGPDRIQPSAEAVGGTPRRCPDISKMRALGYVPAVDLDEGLARTVAWYAENRAASPANALS